jgi:hypothetical protein
MKIRPVGSELLNADRRTDRQTRRSYSCFSSFANEPINYHECSEMYSNTQFERSSGRKIKRSLRVHFDLQNTCSVVDWRLRTELMLLCYTLGVPTALWYEGVWINEIYRHLDVRCRQMTRSIGNVVFRSQFRSVNKVARLKFGAFNRS